MRCPPFLAMADNRDKRTRKPKVGINAKFTKCLILAAAVSNPTVFNRIVMFFGASATGAQNGLAMAASTSHTTKRLVPWND